MEWSGRNKVEWSRDGEKRGRVECGETEWSGVGRNRVEWIREKLGGVGRNWVE